MPLGKGMPQGPLTPRFYLRLRQEGRAVVEVLYNGPDLLHDGVRRQVRVLVRRDLLKPGLQRPLQSRSYHHKAQAPIVLCRLQCLVQCIDTALLHCQALAPGRASNGHLRKDLRQGCRHLRLSRRKGQADQGEEGQTAHHQAVDKCTSCCIAQVHVITKVENIVSLALESFNLQHLGAASREEVLRKGHTVRHRHLEAWDSAETQQSHAMHWEALQGLFLDKAPYPRSLRKFSMQMCTWPRLGRAASVDTD